MIVRRAGSRLLLVAVVAWAGVLGLGACTATAPTEPTIGTVNVTPKLVIDVTDRGVTFRAGPRADPDVQVEPPAVPSGTLVEIANTGARDHRLQGNDGTVFDTGLLTPGQRTAVVLTNSTATDLVVAITDVLGPATDATLVVRPRPGDS